MSPQDLVDLFNGMSGTSRPIRLRLSRQQHFLDDVLLIKHVTGHESMCGGLEYRLLCVSVRENLPLKELIALPVEVQFVTDRGDKRTVCGIVAQAAAGRSDGGLATYQLIVRVNKIPRVTVPHLTNLETGQEARFAGFSVPPVSTTKEVMQTKIC